MLKHQSFQSKPIEVFFLDATGIFVGFLYVLESKGHLKQESEGVYEFQ